MKKMPEFSKCLKIAREARGLTQSELSDISGVNPSQIAHFESGNRLPSFTTLRHLAMALNISCDFFIGLSDSMVIINPIEEIAVDLSALTATDLALVKQIVTFLKEKTNTRKESENERRFLRGSDVRGA